MNPQGTQPCEAGTDAHTEHRAHERSAAQKQHDPGRRGGGGGGGGYPGPPAPSRTTSGPCRSPSLRLRLRAFSALLAAKAPRSRETTDDFLSPEHEFEGLAPVL